MESEKKEEKEIKHKIVKSYPKVLIEERLGNNEMKRSRKKDY